jgi:hypothetical protein|tara:strand:+ start:3471 stop:4472 length:1002 start_codon:yes stop_codon:yes gene_type:complete
MIKINTDEIVKTWQLIEPSIKGDKDKFFRAIFTESKNKIRAAIKGEENFKSVEFVFNKESFKNLDLDFKDTKGIMVRKESEAGYENKLILCIYLKNSVFLDIYLRLVGKIISSIYYLEEERASIQTIYKKLSTWRKCFEDESFGGLTNEEMRGLYAELSYLRKILNENLSTDNAILSWKGPEGGLHDFVHGGCVAEIKSHSKNKEKIRIDNIDQLNYEFYRSLFLASYALENNVNGENLNDLIKIIHNKIGDNQSARSAFDDKLNAYGYYEMHKDKYSQSLKIDDLAIFKLGENFPTILKRELKKGVSDVGFSINISECHEFKIDFEEIKKLF